MSAFARAAGAAQAAIDDAAPLSAADRSTALRLLGLHAAMSGDEGRALADFREARRLDPSAELPADLFPPDHPFAHLYAEAAPGPGGLLVLVVPPPVTPPVTSVMFAPPPAAPPRRHPVPLVGGAVASALVSGGLFALASDTPLDVEPAPGDTATTYAEAVAAQYARRDALRFGGGTAAALSAGLLTAGLTVRW